MRIQKRIWLKLIASVAVCFFFLNIFTIDVLALAPPSGIQNPLTRCEYHILILMRSGQLKFAESAEDIKFLEEKNAAKALLLSHGKILVRKDLKDRPEELVRAIIHEQVEALMQITAQEERSRYSALINMVLGAKTVLPDGYAAEDGKGRKGSVDLKTVFVRLFPEEAISRITEGPLDNELLANHIIAKAFELIIARDGNLLTGPMSVEELLFLEAIEKLINANKHNYFTGVFWNDAVRDQKIRIAMANGMSFVQAALKKGRGQDKVTLSDEGMLVSKLSRVENIEQLHRVIPDAENVLDALLQFPNYTGYKKSYDAYCKITAALVLAKVRVARNMISERAAQHKAEGKDFKVPDDIRDNLNKMNNLATELMDLPSTGKAVPRRINELTSEIHRISLLLRGKGSHRYPIGIPAQLLRELYTAGIFDVVTAKSSLELAGNAMRGGNADSRRTIQRELRYLQDAGLVQQIDGKYHLAGWLSNIKDIEAFIAENPTLSKAAPTKEDVLDLASKTASSVIVLGRGDSNTAEVKIGAIPDFGLFEMTLPEGASKEWAGFAGSLRAFGTPTAQGFLQTATELEKKAAEYTATGQSLILYANDILENAIVIDLEHTLKNILAKQNILTGGKIVLFVRKAVNGKILEGMIRRASSTIDIVTINEDRVRSADNEVKETETVTRLARAVGAKNILALIKGPIKDKDQIELLAAFAEGAKLPLVIVGPDQAVYSLAQALSMAIDAKLSDGAKNGWLIMLPPIRSITDDIKAQYEEYKRSLEALRAA